MTAMKDEEAKTMLLHSLNNALLQYEVKRAWTEKQINQKIKMIENDDKDGTPEERKQAIAKLRMQIDQAEVDLETHATFQKFCMDYLKL